MHWTMINLIRYILWSVFSTSFVSFIQFAWSPHVVYGFTYLLQLRRLLWINHNDGNVVVIDDGDDEDDDDDDDDEWWRQWWWLQWAMLARRACNERATSANFALLVLLRSTAGWSASSLVPANCTSVLEAVLTLSFTGEIPRLTFFISQVSFSSNITKLRTRFEVQQKDFILFYV